MTITHHTHLAIFCPSLDVLRQQLQQLGLHRLVDQLLCTTSQQLCQRIDNRIATCQLNNVILNSWWRISNGCFDVSQQQINQIPRSFSIPFKQHFQLLLEFNIRVSSRRGGLGGTVQGCLKTQRKVLHAVSPGIECNMETLLTDG